MIAKLTVAIITSLFCLFTANAWGVPTVLFDQSHSQAFLIENTNELDLSDLAGVFRDEGLEVRSTNLPLRETDLTGLNGLVISGAFAPLQPEEIQAVSNYIKSGGKVILMLHIARPLAPFMEQLGVMHSNGVIREQQNNIDGKATDFTVSPTADHLITADLKNFSLYGAWAVGAINKDVKIIAATSPSAWVDLNKDGLLNKGDAMQSLGVAAAGDIGAGSFIVFGDDAIFQNRFLINENKKLAVNMAKWISHK